MRHPRFQLLGRGRTDRLVTLLATGRDLESAAQRLRVATVAVSAAERDFRRALDAALRAGWADDDLRHITDAEA
jgi:hypothetical protein